MKLNEVLKSALPYKWVEDVPEFQAAEFEINNKDYSVSFTKYEADEDGDEDYRPDRWDIEFALMPPKDDYTSMSKFNMTRTGDQFVVMSTVQQIIKDWFSDTNPTCITMSAENRSRQLLYTRMLRMVLPTWKIIQNGKSIIAQKLNQ